MQPKALKILLKNLAPLILALLALILCGIYRLGLAQSIVPPANLPGSHDVTGFLNQSIDWYRQIVTEEQVANDPSDVLFVNDDRQTTKQILRLSFDFARADAQLLAGQGTRESQTETNEASRSQSLMHAVQEADNEVRETQAELEADKNKLDTAKRTERQRLLAEIDELQSELDLAQTRSKTLHDILQFVSGASGSEGNMSAQIDQLQRSVPELEAETSKAATGQSSPSQSSGSNSHPVTHRTQPSGLLNLAEDLFSLSHEIKVIDQRTQASDELAQFSERLRAPLIAGLTALAQRGEEAAKEADVSGPAQLEQLKHQLDAITASFKQLSSVALPLSKQEVLFDLYKGNLAHWRTVVKSEYRADLERLLIRLVIFGIALGVVIALAQIWRRAVFRYVHDPRRRYQFLLLRRIILWCAIAITIAFALATEIGSIATFAGLITAGIAVALQNVILAIAGYFFLIGKYGVRVGDRVQISGVTGDVIDIGLIRLHLMEIGGTETDRQPTGRVVVFSNAVVFQPTASFFKQIPGTSFVWHEVSLILAPESDYALAEKRVAGAVEKVYADYRDRIEQQYREMERTLNVPFSIPKPRSRLRLTQSGLEVVIRYPVELDNATEIDDRVVRELLHSLEQPPRLKLVGTGTPNIQPVPEEHKAA
ncbi:MAG TPA: mechanosensitive ion channel domain-containing protein [Candidatus Angelobacter sp.]|nr:mechanosensitive ion channel domain-containing protein [Candidatus Angelobacter sp.]